MLTRLLASTPAPRLVWLLPLSLVAGFAAADFVAGVVHWFADSYFDPATPVLGPLLVEPFRQHHVDPRGITRHGFLELGGNSALATLPLAWGLLALGPPEAGAVLQMAHAGVLALGLALFATNFFHCWAHMKHPPALARRLQAWSLTLTPEAHGLHHGGAFDRSYCVTSGWLNPLLDRTGFFARLEGGLARLGLAPRAPRATTATPRARAAAP